MDRKSSGIGIFLAGFACAVVAIALFGFLYLKLGRLPVATSDPSFPFEAQIVHVPLGARIKREMETPPFQPTQANFVEGAKIYVAQCASCHGTPNRTVDYARWMFPSTPALWKSHRAGVVGVSDDEPGETYWKVKNGIRLSGMPAFQKILSTEQMWDVTLLLKNADKPLDPAVSKILNQEQQP